MPSLVAVDREHMANGRKKENFERGRLELKADPEWIARVVEYGETLGLSLSAFVRLSVNEKMQRMDAERPPIRKRKE
jgi:hypothetical protein